MIRQDKKWIGPVHRCVPTQVLLAALEETRSLCQTLLLLDRKTTLRWEKELGDWDSVIKRTFQVSPFFFLIALSWYCLVFTIKNVFSFYNLVFILILSSRNESEIASALDVRGNYFIINFNVTFEKMALWVCLGR